MEKLNIAELLKDCPKCMELNCTMYEDVYFDYVDELQIIHCYIERKLCKTSITFNQYGTPNSDVKSKCVIFPKGKTTWDGFQKPFKDGDVVFYSNTIAIFKEWGDETLFRTYCTFYTTVSNPTYQFEISRPLFGKGIRKEARFATEEEKQKLFNAIKANGYKWNPETKTLEKLIEPKFKVGDKVQWGLCAYISIRTIKSIENDRYMLDDDTYIKFSDEHLYRLIKFDSTTLKPFESKVLVRDTQSQTWKPAIYGYKAYSLYTVVGGRSYCQCIPYEGNEHLLGTTNDCDDYYKTWK